jgi:hypothetical protein
MMTDWKPIETAPKDGTKILVVTVHGEIELTEWYEIWHDEYIEASDGLYHKRRVKSHEGWNGNNPQLWMPLPAIPLLADGPAISDVIAELRAINWGGDRDRAVESPIFAVDIIDGSSAVRTVLIDREEEYAEGDE